MKNLRDIVGSSLLIIYGIGVIIESLRLGLGEPTMPDPGFFPFIGALVLIGLSSVLLVYGFLGRSKAPQEAFGELKRPVILVVSMSIYTAILEPFGYVLPTMALAVIILAIMGVKSWKVFILTSVGFSIGTYVLFGKILGIDLPAGPLTFIG